MNEARALTLPQPHATLVMLGVQQIVTMPKSFPETVPLPARILIHASKRPIDLSSLETMRDALQEPKFMGVPERWWDDDDNRTFLCANGHASHRYLRTESRGDLCLACRKVVRMVDPEWGRLGDLPLGAVLGWLTITDSVPIYAHGVGAEVLPRIVNMPDLVNPSSEQHLYLRHHWHNDGRVDVEDQRPFGDFTPGRFGWLLTDPAPFPEPIPARGHQGLWRPDDALLAALSAEASDVE